MKISKFHMVAPMCALFLAFSPTGAGFHPGLAALSGDAEAPLTTTDGGESMEAEHAAQTGASGREAGAREDMPVATAQQKTEGVVERGDTITKILDTASGSNSQHYVHATRKVFALNSFRVGQPYTVITDPRSGRLKRFEYEINSTRRLVVEGDEEPRARLEDIEFTTALAAVSAAIDDNLFQAVADAGESPQLAVRLVELFGSEINFIKNIQEGDSFRVLIEKRYRHGEYKGYGRILAARFVNCGRTYEAFLFPNASGGHEYYNARGENLRKTLLQAPLAVTRMTSRYTHSRRHPILGQSRPHLGVDYGAPTGTPVKAVGDGIVSRRGWAGGYGNQVIIKHDSGLESLYSHLSGFGRGLGAGSRVRQGQVIGYVGSTGLSTGPHLDFRLRQKGAFINPAKAINPRGAPVPSGGLAAFKRIVEQERDYLDGGDLPEHYTADSLLPRQQKSLAKNGAPKKTAQSARQKPQRKAKSRVRNRS